jgi:hypothetical protein
MDTGPPAEVFAARSLWAFFISFSWLKILRGSPLSSCKSHKLCTNAPCFSGFILKPNCPPPPIFFYHCRYVHTARSVSSSSDDSLSADSYLNVLYMPSFNKQDRSRRSSEDSADSHQAPTMQGNIEECPRTHLDDQRYEESVYYLQEVSYLSNPSSNIVSLTILLLRAVVKKIRKNRWSNLLRCWIWQYSRQDLMQFMFQHCHYSDACSLFFPPDGLPPPPLPSPYQTQVPPSSPQRPDPLATEYGSLDELCDLCVGYTAVPALERVIASRIIESSNPDSPVAQHTAAALTRICTYFENHRHFNHLYRFQVSSALLTFPKLWQQEFLYPIFAAQRAFVFSLLKFWYISLFLSILPLLSVDPFDAKESG